jgi:hypothetical protein
VPRALIPRFGTLTTAELRGVRLAPGGNAIIDNDAVDYSVSGVLRLISRIAEQRRAAGSVRSEKKAAAVRVNGAKGGRPKKRDAFIDVISRKATGTFGDKKSGVFYETIGKKGDAQISAGMKNRENDGLIEIPMSL